MYQQILKFKSNLPLFLLLLLFCRKSTFDVGYAIHSSLLWDTHWISRMSGFWFGFPPKMTFSFSFSIKIYDRKVEEIISQQHFFVKGYATPSKGVRILYWDIRGEVVTITHQNMYLKRSSLIFIHHKSISCFYDQMKFYRDIRCGNLLYPQDKNKC